MATTIQTIELPKKARALDTSGNNNHGQIYSGRGLEFDGVSDYLDTDFAFSPTNHTVAFWIKLDDTAAVAQIFDARQTTDQGIWIKNNASEQIVYYCDTDTVTSTYGYIDTWIRVVCTYDGTTQKLYINGVLDVSEAGTMDRTTTNNAIIGQRFDAGSNSLAGKMSDFQAWNATWTAADVTYDYLNPESLALNNSGTSLTNSNLKLWYPMQDGHRGQQSYILDGANTGIVSATVDHDFSTDTTSEWATADDSVDDDRGAISYVADGFLRVTYTGTSGAVLNKASALISGKNYKITFRAKGTHDAIFASVGNNNDIGYAVSNPTLTTDWQDYEFYIAATQTILRLYQSGTPDVNQTLDIDNILVQPINDKNHATTVFYGDEMVLGDDLDFDTIDKWTGSGATLSSENDGGSHTSVLKILTTSGDLNDRAELAQSNLDTTTVAGRSYRCTFDYRYVQNTSMSTNGGISIGNTLTSDVVYTNTSWTAYDTTFVAADNSTAIRIYANISSGASGNILYVDNFSIKEIGTASGWTDADQQLHIPQTALQSYNELAWFDGEDDYVECGDYSNPDLAVTGWSVSAWFNSNHSNSDESYGAIVSKYHGNAGFFMRIQKSTNEIVLNIGNGGTASIYNNSVFTVTEGLWYHIVLTYSGTTTELANVYINGENVLSDQGITSGSSPAYAIPSKQFHIGGNYSGGSESFAGSITEVSTYSDVLTQAEVNDLYNDGKAKSALEADGSGGLSAYWRNNGLSTWTDLKGSNDGTVTCDETILIPAGVDATRDNQGFIMNRQKDTSTLNLDGKSYATVLSVPSFDEEANISISCWIKSYQPTTGNNYIVSLPESSSGTNGADIRINSTTITFDLHTHSDDAGTNVQSTLTKGEWVHITVTYDGTTARIYKNGVAGDTHAVTVGDGIKHASGDIEIGRFGTYGAEATGFIDGVLVYNTALSQPQIERNYNATKGSHRN